MRSNLPVLDLFLVTVNALIRVTKGEGLVVSVLEEIGQGLLLNPFLVKVDQRGASGKAQS